jgi:hypothetical protein
MLIVPYDRMKVDLKDVAKPEPSNEVDHYKKVLKATGSYDVDQGGNLCEVRRSVDEDGKTTITLTHLANFLARPFREITEDNGVETSLMFEIEGRLSGGRKLSPALVLAPSFSSLGWVPSSWGMQAIIAPGSNKKDKVRHAIQLMSDGIKREHVFTHLGWRKVDENWHYLHAGGAIGNDQIKVNVEREGLQRYRLPLQGDKQTLIDAIRCSLDAREVADHQFTYTLLAMIGLAPLCQPLRKVGIEPAFILWSIGESGTRKSTITALFMNHFGVFPDGKSLPANFKDTANALEKKAFATKDSILVVDDFHPKATQTELRHMEGIAQQLLRGYGDRHARSRMRPDGTLRSSYPPRGLAIVTGEDVPRAGISTSARYLSVEVKRESVNLEKLTQAQAKAEMYSQTMVGYIQYLSDKIETIGDELKETFIQIRNETVNGKQHGRLPETVAWLHIGLSNFMQYAFEAGAITEQERDSISKEGLDIFKYLANRHSANMVEDKPINQFLNALRELIATEKVYVNSLINPTDHEYGDLIGCSDANYLYLYPDSTINAVTQFYAHQNRTFPITKDTLLKHLENDQLILVKQNGDRTERTPGKKIGGKTVRCIWLLKSAVQSSNDDESQPHADTEEF